MVDEAVGCAWGLSVRFHSCKDWGTYSLVAESVDRLSRGALDVLNPVGRLKVNISVLGRLIICPAGSEASATVVCSCPRHIELFGILSCVVRILCEVS